MSTEALSDNARLVIWVRMADGLRASAEKYVGEQRDRMLALADHYEDYAVRHMTPSQKAAAELIAKVTA